jgi:hypothetical protein
LGGAIERAWESRGEAAQAAEPWGQAEVKDRRVRLSLKPNEIITLRFRTSR